MTRKQTHRNAGQGILATQKDVLLMKPEERIKENLAWHKDQANAAEGAKKVHHQSCAGILEWVLEDEP